MLTNRMIGQYWTQIRNYSFINRNDDCVCVPFFSSDLIDSKFHQCFLLIVADFIAQDRNLIFKINEIRFRQRTIQTYQFVESILCCYISYIEVKHSGIFLIKSLENLIYSFITGLPHNKMLFNFAIVIWWEMSLSRQKHAILYLNMRFDKIHHIVDSIWEAESCAICRQFIH